jgi:divalent metal cation (Fe/Co/Zn/Cd) transporter
MDGVDPELTERVEAVIAEHSRAGGAARLRWSGHRLHVEVTVPIATDAHLVELASVTSNVERGVRRALPHVGSVSVVPGFATDGPARTG